MSWMDNYRQSLEDGTYYSDGYRYINNAISEILKQNYSKWMNEDELRSVLHDIHELLQRESRVMSHDDISQLEFAREDIANRLESLSKDGIRKSNPTGIANPADYMSSIKVTETKKDIDGDGDVDKVEIEKK